MFLSRPSKGTKKGCRFGVSEVRSRITDYRRSKSINTADHYKGKRPALQAFRAAGRLVLQSKSKPMSMKTRALLVALSLVFAAACTTRPQEPSARYHLKGKVVSVDRAHRRVTIAHEAIPGFMEAMTMPFAIRDEWPFRVLAPGQQISGTLVLEEGRTWLEEISIIDRVIDPMPARPVATEPEPGTEVPDFFLTNQDGSRIHLKQYRGRALLLTFIYTRCPLPDYCPRLSANFAQVYRRMRAEPLLAGKLHLLTVSFDPGFDTKEVLRGYAGNYVGPGENPFQYWEFGSGNAEEVKAITGYFGLTYWPENNQIVHSLRTALIGPDGRLAQLYRGNEWTPADVLRDLESLR
jgi:protein SCO1/2